MKSAALGICNGGGGASAIVIGQKAKGDQVGDAILKEGMEDLFESIGKELGALLQKRREEVGAA